MSDLYVNTGYKDTYLAPFGPIGIIAHTSNKAFVKQVSDVLSTKRNCFGGFVGFVEKK